MTLSRHARHYTLIAACNGWSTGGVLVAFTHLGMAVVPANIAGRVAGALLGYWLNGKVPFAGDDHEIGPSQLRRYVTMWLATTAISTWALGVDRPLGRLQWAWLAKRGWKRCWAWSGSCSRGTGSTASSVARPQGGRPAAIDSKTPALRRRFHVRRLVSSMLEGLAQPLQRLKLRGDLRQALLRLRDFHRFATMVEDPFGFGLGGQHRGLVDILGADSRCRPAR